jgi:phosphomannomutase
MMLFAEDVLAKNNGGQIIFDVKCSNSLAQIIEVKWWGTNHVANWSFSHKK